MEEQRIDIKAFQKLIKTVNNLPCKIITEEEARKLRIKRLKKEIEDAKWSISCLISKIEIMEKELVFLEKKGKKRCC